jgi:hypothetical protein
MQLRQGDVTMKSHDAPGLCRPLIGLALAAGLCAPLAASADDDADLSIGTDNGHKNYINFQPVVPVTLNADWNVISRTILPLVSQSNVVPGTHQSGIGDIVQSLFFSPKKPTDNGVIWGLGPVFLLPTASDDFLGAGKWGAGPTGVALKQDGPWTYGLLFNHIWSFAGDSSRPSVNSTFLQPFLSYTTPDAWTYGINTESTYDWRAKQWSVPINLFVSKLVKFGTQPVSLGAGVRYWADSPDTGPSGWGFRVIVTFLFPR